MNCRHFQAVLYEYVEDSLSPRKKAAAERHLARCEACRESVGEQHQIAGVLIGEFRQHTADLKLRPEVQGRVLSAVRTNSASISPGRLFFSSCLRFAFPKAIAVLVVGVVLLGLAHFLQGPDLKRGRPRGNGLPAALVLMDISYCVPSYTFKREASFVIDALTCENRVVRQTFSAVNR